MENRAYQHKLEELVDELNARLEQRKREIDALNRLFKSHIGQAGSAQDAYSRLKDSLGSFTLELEELAAIAGIPRQEERNVPEDYKVK